MGLFTRHSTTGADLRDRDYVLIGCPLVAQDGYVVLVDATVRLTVRRSDDRGGRVLGYDPSEEGALHAVCVVVLRLMAATVPSDELLVGRARVSEALEQGLAFAPVGAGIDARVLAVEVRPHDSDLVRLEHEFRLVGVGG